ncbi:hypothetical protein [Thermoactinospora rubra]|uniref:hypothetical protein n=1 Tax=Thermoactinospora rubra TaxID=1088767 RepID=UPI000A11435E|nr:hypothetical protein [Thermoactinospora rubra]
MEITISLPVALTSLFVVAVERMPVAMESLVPWRIGRPYKRAALAALGTPALTVTHRRCAWRPVGVNLPDDERRFLRRARHHVLVSSTAPPHDHPHAVQVARAAARALAEECGGLVVDPLTGSAVVACDGCPGERPEFQLGDDWVGWDIEVRDHASCPPWNPSDNHACACLRVTSRGLRRFALPELTLEGAACAHSLCAVSLLRAVAHRLVTDHLAFVAAHPGSAARTISDHLHVDRDTPDDGTPFLVRLTPCDDPGSLGAVPRLRVDPAPGATDRAACLKVAPPAGFSGTLNDWLCATQRPGLVRRVPVDADEAWAA